MRADGPRRRDSGPLTGSTLLGLAAGLLVTACASAPIGEASPSGPTMSAPPPASSAPILEGAYSEGQASRGEDRFQRSCSACHQRGEFTGGRFRLRWGGQTAEDIFAFISTAMPDDEPGSLTPGQYADLVAYFLSLNGYPAGEMDLPPETDVLRALRLDSPSN